MQHVLVTGATGLVGSWLVQELLARGKTVATFVVDADPASELLRSGVIGKTRVVNGRLESYSDVERAILLHEVDTLFHLGAQTLVGSALRSPLATFETNIRGTWNVLEACRRGGVARVLVASSDKAYGEAPQLPYTESTPLRGRHPYDVSKSCTDLLAQSYFHTYGLATLIARCGNIYGGGDLNWSRIVPGTIRSLLRNERPVLRSDGTFVRDYIYVKDVVDSYLTLAERGRPGEAYNFSSGKGLTVRELVRAIQVTMGKEHLESQVLNTARAEIHDQVLDPAKAQVELGWTPRYDLAAGLRETVQWYEGYFR